MCLSEPTVLQVALDLYTRPTSGLWMPYLCKFHLNKIKHVSVDIKLFLVCLQSNGWFVLGPAKQKIQSLFLSHSDGQLVFLTEQERAGLAQINPCSSEPSDSSLLDRLFSTNISSVYRMGKIQAVLRSHIVTEMLRLQ